MTDYWYGHDLLAFPPLSQDLSSASCGLSPSSNTQSHECSSAAFRVPREEVGGRSLTPHNQAGSYQPADQRHDPVWMCSARAAEESLPSRGVLLLFEVVAPGSSSEASATTRHGHNAKYIFRQFPCATTLLVLECHLFFFLF